MLSSRRYVRLNAGPGRLASLALLMLSIPFTNVFGEKVLYETESQYHYIRVTQKGPIRTLYFRKGLGAAKQSSINIRHRLRLELEYTQMVFIGLAYIGEPKRVLIVGLGGGQIPSALRHYYPRVAIDCVEIDPEILHVAEAYFFFKNRPPTRTIIADGRAFIRRAAASGWRYDMVVLDAFTSTYIPPHMMTKEFLELTARIASPDGCVVSNIHASNMLYDYQQRTYAKVFPQNYTFLGRRSSNAIVVSLPRPGRATKEQMAARAAALQKQHRFAFDLTRIATMYLDKPNWKTEGDILTDDFSPVNLLRMRAR